MPPKIRCPRCGNSKGPVRGVVKLERIGAGGKKYYYRRFAHKQYLPNGKLALKYCYARDE